MKIKNTKEIASQKEARQRIKKLKEVINHHRYLYHVLDRQEISDGALDSLKQELALWEEKFPELITPDSPTQRVGGAPMASFKKKEHSQTMLSLFDAFSEQDMLDWETRLKKLVPNLKLEYFCELKLDGLAIALRYKQGEFAFGITRGDGKVGEDVSSNVKTIEAVPLKLRVPEIKELESLGFTSLNAQAIQQVVLEGEIEIRGEVVMPYQAFKNLNKRFEQLGKPKLINPRNAVAGSIRQLDPRVVAERKLDFYGFELLGDFNLDTQAQKINLLKLLGIKVLSENKVCTNLEQVFAFQKEWIKHRDKLPWGVDGVVVKINQIKYWPVLGVVGKAPRYMMAYKFPAEQVTTKIKDVVWQIGRTGVLTPTALLEPVVVAGATVSRASLHNFDEIKRLDLQIGDTVILERAGDVIPKIIQVLPKLRTGKEKKVSVPTNCPRCDSPVIKNQGEVAYRCQNQDCYAVNQEKLIHWASKAAVDIPGLGEKIVEQLMQANLVNSPSDFYKLKVGDLLPLERFSHKSANNLITAITNRKTITLPKFIYALGISQVGEETALLLAKKMVSDLDIKTDSVSIIQLKKYFTELTSDNLQSLKDIGPVVALSITSWFKNKKNLELLAELESVGVTISISGSLQATERQVLQGKKFVLTGSLSGLTRQEVKTKIRELGGEVASTVSTKVDYVIVGENPGSKYDQARKLGLVIISEDQFQAMIS